VRSASLVRWPLIEHGLPTRIHHSHLYRPVGCGVWTGGGGDPAQRWHGQGDDNGEANRDLAYAATLNRL
jgi:hypothetical protein